MTTESRVQPPPQKKNTKYLLIRPPHLKLLEDSEGLLVELGADGDVGNVRGVVVVQPVDVLHHLAVVRLDGRQDQQVLQVPAR